MVTKQGIYRKYLEDAKYTKSIHQSVSEAVSLHLGLHAALMYTFCIHQCCLKTLKHTLCIHHCCLKALMYTLCIDHCCFKAVMYTHSIHQWHWCIQMVYINLYCQGQILLDVYLMYTKYVHQGNVVHTMYTLCIQNVYYNSALISVRDGAAINKFGKC